MALSKMSSQPVQCKICQEWFKSQKGLFLHVSKSHKSDGLIHACEYCNKSFESITKLNNHYPTCRVKKTREQSEVIDLKQQIEMMTQEMDLLKKENDMLKKSRQTINNTINNNTNNTLINIQTCQAITDVFLQDCLHQVTQSGIVLESATDMAKHMFNTDLQNRIVKTDNSRNVIKWQDGDKNLSVKDPQGRILAKKTLTATNGQLKQLFHSYNNTLKETIETDDSDDQMQEKTALFKGTLFMSEAFQQSGDVLDEFGKTIGKMGFHNPEFLPPCQTNKTFDRLRPFVDLISECIKKSPHMLLTNPEHLGCHISVCLSDYIKRPLVSSSEDDTSGITERHETIFQYNGMHISKRMFIKCFQQALKQCVDNISDLLLPFIPCHLIEPHLKETDNVSSVIQGNLRSLEMVLKDEAESQHYLTRMTQSL